MNEKLQGKLEKLLAKHQDYRADFQTTIKGWAQDFKKAVAIKSFGENDIIKTFRKGLRSSIREMNQILLYKDGLEVRDRERLMDKRSMYVSFLNLFSRAEVTLESLDKEISFELGEKDTQEE